MGNLQIQLSSCNIYLICILSLFIPFPFSPLLSSTSQNRPRKWSNVSSRALFLTNTNHQLSFLNAQLSLRENDLVSTGQFCRKTITTSLSSTQASSPISGSLFLNPFQPFCLLFVHSLFLLLRFPLDSVFMCTQRYVADCRRKVVPAFSHSAQLSGCHVIDTLYKTGSESHSF